MCIWGLLSFISIINVFCEKNRIRILISKGAAAFISSIIFFVVWILCVSYMDPALANSNEANSIIKVIFALATAVGGSYILFITLHNKVEHHQPQQPIQHTTA
jgi:hypothetical protein